jgi:hypothetical protein
VIQSLIGQEGGGGLDFIWYLLPLLCCMMTMGQRGESTQEAGTESESFYTTHDIQESFGKIEEEVAKWRLEAAEKKEASTGVISSIRNILAGGRSQERFVEKENNPPRLLSLTDSSGPVYFEFTEVEGGGTVVKATYARALKRMVATLKAGLSLRIPASPVGLKCPSCGKPVLREFNLCPYCGSELIKE